jgi:uncharacterized protein (DUF2147 family)
LPLNGWIAVLILGATLAAVPARAAGPEGRWLTQDRGGVIEIGPCDGGLCGRIVGMNETRRRDGSIPTDPEGHPTCGLTILHAEPDGPGQWSGHIADPDTGTSWNCTLRLDAADHLLLRGYVLLPLFGQTQTWTRYPDAPGAGCAMTD